jgi:hypothetical protein
MKIGLGMYNMQDSLEVVPVYVVGTSPALVFLQQPGKQESRNAKGTGFRVKPGMTTRVKRHMTLYRHLL